MDRHPTLDTGDLEALAALELRLRTILPEEYQGSYDSVRPTPMASAGLKYDVHGEVAWGDIWATFCDLAMAGGPPHKGTLLDRAPDAAIEQQPERYDAVVQEICRGITLASFLPAEAAGIPGWVRVTCHDATMAGWLYRAIAIENVAVWADGRMLHLPAGPHFRLEKEIKNVVTVVAKTSHYWSGHLPRVQQLEIADLFEEMDASTPLIAPAVSTGRPPAAEDEAAAAAIAERIRQRTSLPRSNHRCGQWIGIGCPDVRSAIWMMRALVADNVISRREETTLFVPLNRARGAEAAPLVDRLARVYRFAGALGVV